MCSQIAVIFAYSEYLPFVLMSYFTFTSVTSHCIAAILALDSYLLMIKNKNIFYIYLQFIFIDLCVVDPRSHQVYILFCQNNYFNLSCDRSLLVINSFSFCLFEKVFISPLFLKDFLGEEFWAVLFLSAF